MMDDGAFTPNTSTMFGNIDYDFMDQLFDEGCWVQTADGFGFPQPAYSFPTGGQKAEEGLDSPTETQNTIQTFGSSGDDLNKIWIAPRVNPGSSSSMRDRLVQAIWNLRESNKDREVLIQIWVPVRRGLKSFLTTVEQPYFHDPASMSLVNYRNISEGYQFPADEGSSEALGLPGRVFVRKVPEWTPDVRLFRQEEYPRVGFAHSCNVRGSIALPVFERSSGNCLAVVEIVTTTQKVNYRPEIDRVCDALEAVDLRCSDTISPSRMKGGTGGYEAALPDIINVLRTVCHKHGLPLAQTWASCMQQGKDGCWNSDKDAHCTSIVKDACYVRDSKIQDFHVACLEHHLLRGQGVAGKAFMTNQPCFATDITAFSKDEYPLSHHAKIFGLHAAVAMQVRSSYSKRTYYVLEFFLPADRNDAGLALHCEIVESMTMALHQGSRYLNFLTVDDLQQQSPSGEKTDEKDLFELASSSSRKHQQEETSWISHMIESPKKKGKGVALSSGLMKDEPRDDFTVITNWTSSVAEPRFRQVIPDGGIEQDSRLEGDAEVGVDSFGGHHTSGARKAGEKRKTKAQKTISLQVLRQYFAGSLKDAARDIGVCPTTLKRICRQHGISRWPSRKIKKVGHSLKKLQLVIDSVQGAEGAIHLSSFYSNFPELSSPNISTSNQISSLNINDPPKHQNTQAEGSIFGSGATSSRSASTPSSQTSGSSQSFSTTLKASAAIAKAMGSTEASTAENTIGLEKGLQSKAQMHVSGQERPSFPETSSLREHPWLESVPPPLRMTSNFPIKDGVSYKVKVTFGEEKIRFSILQSMSFDDLQLEIARRFGMDDVNKFHIKYLDDDKEWVLLTCDADLDECIEIYSSTRRQTIKLSIHRACPPSLGSSLGSNGLP